MIYNLLLFLAPAPAISRGQAQATIPKPPAVSGPVSGSSSCLFKKLKLIVDVVGNAVGFTGILAACWLSLQLVQTYMS